MKLTKNHIIVIQRILNTRFNLQLRPDGIAGQKTLSAVLRIREIPSNWPKNRQLVGVIQWWSALIYNIDAGPVDGYWGPQTEEAYIELIAVMNTGVKPQGWRKEEGEGAVSKNDWPIQTTAALNKFYGPVGENQTQIKLPYPLKIAWNTKQVVKRLTCHEMVAKPVTRVLENVKKYYGKRIPALGLDMFGGCLNVRRMRGGTAWSTHSWGIAFDFDPANNRLKWKRGRARFSRPEYDKWFEIWEAEGATGLGPAKNYDWMHTQFANVR